MVSFSRDVKLLEFLREEDAQASGEYIMLAGGIIVVAVVIYALYYSMVKSSARSINTSAENVTSRIETLVRNVSLG
jgi:uncharacterized protein (UPF0333 family)